MLEKHPKLPQKNGGNHLSQNSHTSQQVRIHKFSGKPFVPITCLNINDQIITDDSQKAETLSQHYDNMSKSTNLDPTFQAAKTAQEDIFKICLPNIENERINLNSQFTLFELNHALSSKHNSAPRADMVSYEMLKQLPDQKIFLILLKTKLSCPDIKVHFYP